MTECVLDASALLAVLRQEPGSDVVESRLRMSVISAVNLTEVIEKSSPESSRQKRIFAFIRNWQVEVVPYDAEQAVIAARLRREIRRGDVSLADRACLSLAEKISLPVLTADRIWSQLALSIEVVQIRGTLQ